MDTDRNILFGVLALRAGLVDTEQLAAALDRWMHQQKYPLADLLVQANGLKDEDRAHIEYLLERQLQRNGNSARAALAALADANVRSALGGVRDDELREWLANALPGGLWLEPGARTGRGWRIWAVVGALVILLLLLVGGAGVVMVGIMASRERVLAEMHAQRAEMQARLEAEQAAAAARLDREVLDRALRTVVGKGDDPQTALVREKFLRELLAAHQDRERKNPNDAGIRRAIADLHEQLAEHHLKARELDKAEDAFRQAITVYSQLGNQPPRSGRSRRDMSRCQARLAAVLREAGKPKEAEQALRDAISTQQNAQAFDGSGNWMLHQHELASLHHQLARLLHDAGRLEEAERSYTEAENLWQVIGTSGVVNTDQGLERARCRTGFGRLLLSRKRLTEAEKAFRDAIGYLGGLTGDAPRAGVLRQEMAAAYEGLANALTAAGKDKEAAEALQKAKKQQEDKKEENKP